MGPQRTRYTLPRFAPGAWWIVEEVALNGPSTLYYRLKPSQAKPSAVRDERGRSALEAFAALPMKAMEDRLRAYGRALREDATTEWDGAHALELVAELVTFVRTFGPIGVGWGGDFGVQNNEADRLQREIDTAHWVALGIDPGSVSSTEPSSFWRASFWGHGPGRGALPRVERRYWHPNEPWSERVRLGDEGLPCDGWSSLADEYKDLNLTLELAEAIAQGDQFGCRRATAKFVGENTDFWVGAPRPLTTDYGRALNGIRPASGHVKLFALPDHQVDWVVLGKSLVADLITRQIDFAMPAVDLSADEGFAVRWRATSVLEVIYLQLLEHVRHRSSFGIGRCEACGGPILRTRHLGGTGNRWHSGCGSRGRVRRWRLEQAARSSVTRPETEENASAKDVAPVAAPLVAAPLPTARSASSASGLVAAETDPNRP